MRKRKVRVNLQIEYFGQRYKLVIDRKAIDQKQEHCNKCDLKGTGLCFWDDQKNIHEDSMTANLFCYDGEYARWVGYWKRMNKPTGK